MAAKKKKTSIYLEEAHLRRLHEIADRIGVSQAYVVREAILRYAEEIVPRREFSLDGAGNGPGGTVASVAEEELLKGFGE